MKTIHTCLISALILLSTISFAQTFEEKNGQLNIEAEELPFSGSWKKQTAVKGYTGSGYINWTGADQFNTPNDAALITTSIKINTPGKYLFKWINKVGEGTNPTEFNDTWLKFPEASKFYGEKGTSIVYPKGSGKLPIPAGAGGKGYFKVYCSGTTAWTDRSSTSDKDGHAIYVEFDKAGTYTMLISARSASHLIDKISLNRTGGTTTGGTGGDIIQGRMAVVADGNYRDSDDIAGTPVSLAILRAFGLEKQLVHYSHSCDLRPGTNDPGGKYRETEMKISSEESAVIWGGFDHIKFYNCQTEKTATINHLRDQINASTATDPLWIIEAGEPDIMWEAVNKAQVAKRKYVYIVTHHPANDKGDDYDLDDVIKLGIPNSNVIRIPDQNVLLKKPLSDWYWARDHSDDRVKWLWERGFRAQEKSMNYPAIVGKMDPSDAGMIYYWATLPTGGDENCDVPKLKALFLDYIKNGPPDNSCKLTLEGLKDFANLNVNGFVTSYKDEVRGAIAVDSKIYGEKWAATNTSFTGNDGKYDITLTTLTETDGESFYKLVVNGSIVGTYQNPTSNVDYAPSTKTWNNVTVKKGDVIQIEIKAHTNGKIPEGTGTAYARARWTKVDLVCSTIDGTNKPPVASFSNNVKDKLQLGYSEFYVAVDATDPDGDAISTLLLIDGNEVRKENSAPYEWGKVGTATSSETLGLPVGSHELTVVVTDSKGASTTVRLPIIVSEKKGPFNGVMNSVPGVIEAENFDTGGQDVGYNDADLENNGGEYRPNESVDIVEGRSGFSVGYTTTGEWLEYTIDVAKSEEYDIIIHYSSGRAGAKLGMELPIESTVLFSSLDLPQTAGWDDYKTVTKTNVQLEQGEKVLRINLVQNGFNIDKIELKPSVVTGSDELLSAIEINVFPNPSQGGVFNLSSPVNWSVYSLQGLNLMNGNSTQINLSDESIGIYFLRVGNLVQKIIVR